jgi:hypothetical protein
MNSWTHFMDEAYDCASHGVSHLVRMQQQYVRERQDRKRAAVAAVAVVLAMVVAYGWAYSNALDYDTGSDSLRQPHD